MTLRFELPPELTTLKDEKTFLCDTRTLVPAVRVETDNGTKSAEVTIRVKRRC